MMKNSLLDLPLLDELVEPGAPAASDLNVLMP